MNRSTLIQITAERSDRPVEEVETVVSTFFEIVADTLANGEPVNLRKFGKLEPRLRRSMTKPNPRTGDMMEIPERVSVALLPSDLLKARLNKEEPAA
jgi:nucleoid DNA-binding protein